MKESVRKRIEKRNLKNALLQREARARFLKKKAIKARLALESLDDRGAPQPGPVVKTSFNAKTIWPEGSLKSLKKTEKETLQALVQVLKGES